MTDFELKQRPQQLLTHDGKLIWTRLKTREVWHTLGVEASKTTNYDRGSNFKDAEFATARQAVEIIRMCFKSGVQVIGGVSKMIKKIQQLDTRDIISYQDGRLGFGQHTSEQVLN
jgi:hypothetical protein